MKNTNPRADVCCPRCFNTGFIVKRGKSSYTVPCTYVPQPELPMREDETPKAESSPKRSPGQRYFEGV